MTTTPILNGQVIGQAERATRAVLETLLADTGIPFTNWVTVNQLAARGGSVETATLVDAVAIGLVVDPAVVRGALDELVAAGLVTRFVNEVVPPGDLVQLTPAGIARHDEISAGIARITERLYAGLPDADLAVARVVLETLTERARAEIQG